jgi:hypothetical protein
VSIKKKNIITLKSSMGIGVHLIDLFLIMLLKQKLKLEFLVKVNAD